jgi:phosphoglycerol geranylgeranyltransferase
MVNHDFAAAVAAIKKASRLPLIIFPGESTQLSPDADALLFLSLISGRNPRWLIEEHVQAAPAIKQMGLETIPTGYLLISSGTATAVERVSGTPPLPRENPDLAAAHALAGQYLGLKLIYLEAGSGARQSVPDELISRVRRNIDLPIIVGGGIRAPEEAAEKVKAGADFIVIGTAFDGGAPPEMMEPFSTAIRKAARGG